jgi:ketosteroid isomerase-like protein
MPTPETVHDDEATVATIVRELLAAVSRGDRAAILARHGEDLLMFDFPDTVRGLAEYDQTWSFFDDSRRGPVTFDPKDLVVRTGGSAAFAYCLVHCDGTTAGSFDFRLTVGFERRDGEWLITHEHHSVPTRDEVLVMPEKRDDLSA